MIGFSGHGSEPEAILSEPKVSYFVACHHLVKLLKRSRSARAMDECSSGSVADRVQCILTYGGATWRQAICSFFRAHLEAIENIVINYSLLICDVAYCAWCVRLWHLRPLWPLAELLAVMTFQVLLCLLLGCSGVSIVWCAIVGWYVLARRGEHPAEAPLGLMPLGSIHLYYRIYKAYTSGKG